MTLNKRLGVLFKRKSAQIIGCIVLCMISVAFLIICTEAGKALETTLANFTEEANVEDANFSTVKEISNDDITKIEKDYNVKLEKMSFIDIDYNDTTLRTFCVTDKINGYALKEGSDLTAEGDILINDFYAENNDITIGDTVKLNGSEFKIVGYFTRSDYLTPVKDPTDSVMGTEFGIAIVSKNDYEKFDSNGGYYSIVYSEDNNIEVRNYLHDEYMLMSYVSRDNNSRISSAITQASTVTQMALMFGPFLFLLTVVFVMLVMSKILKNEKMEIGILSALGYKKREIGVFYSKLSLFISIIGAALGAVVGQLLARPICEFYASINNCPNILSKDLFNIEYILIAMVIPIVLLWFTARFMVHKYLKKEVINLIRNVETKKSKNVRFLKKSKLSSGLKYSLRSLFRNPGRTVAFVLGIAIASSVTLMGLVMRTSIIYTIDVELQEGVEYEYTYYLNAYNTEELEKGDGIVSMSLEYKNSGSSVSVVGIPDDTEYFNFKTTNGEIPDYENKFYISAVLAEIVGANVGDEMVFINPITTEEYTVKVDGIIDINRSQTIYSSIENINELLGNEETTAYNAVVSNEKLIFDDGMVAQTLVNSEFVESMQNTLARTMLSVANLLLFLGAVVGVIVVYMITTMTVEENQSNISMLKILGYTNKEISKMIFRVNKYFVVAFFALMIYPIYMMCEAEFVASAADFNMIIPARIDLSGIIFTGFLMIASYYVALFMSRKKIYKADMVESLKKNRE